MTSEVHGHPNAEPAEPMAEFAEQPAPWLAPAQQPRPAPPAPPAANQYAPPTADHHAPPQQYTPPQQYAPPQQPTSPVDAAVSAAAHRATGTAHVPDVTLLPAHQLPMLPAPVPRVYGRPAPQSAAPAPDPVPSTGHPAPPSPAPATSFGTPAVSTSYPSGASTSYPAGVPTTYQSGTFQPTPTQPAPAQATVFQPQTQWPDAPTSPGPHQSSPQSGPAIGAQPVRPTPTPAAPAPSGYTPPTGPGNAHLGMLIAVGAVVLLAVVGLIAFMWPNSPSEQQFTVGSCVRESNQVATPVECTAAGAYKIVSQVQRKEQCEDQTQPHVELGSGKNRVLCLTPARAEDSAGSSASPDPSASG